MIQSFRTNIYNEFVNLYDLYDLYFVRCDTEYGLFVTDSQLDEPKIKADRYNI